MGGGWEQLMLMTRERCQLWRWGVQCVSCLFLRRRDLNID